MYPRLLIPCEVNYRNVHIDVYIRVCLVHVHKNYSVFLSRRAHNYRARLFFLIANRARMCVQCIRACSRTHTHIYTPTSLAVQLSVIYAKASRACSCKGVTHAIVHMYTYIRYNMFHEVHIYMYIHIYAR